MNKSIKLIFLIVGVVLLGYGIYTMIIPETQISIGDLDLVEAQNNTDAYITIGLGLLALLISFLGSRKS
ncbi:hypothetical protein EV196_104123 [Mariniflexile fucanivorans]|uniref:Uncharacterized protein n=1 Tax=Mariniflexile fucanivorans TaxID=264023 RepID=A0A4R1RJ02_9FLAO|nr:hypothetical protein [Mariniflexile fucanivorans]TCL66093.1 hypothetical protein EV196_104123 [Mariniflexile fucanivorans]